MEHRTLYFPLSRVVFADVINALRGGTVTVEGHEIGCNRTRDTVKITRVLPRAHMHAHKIPSLSRARHFSALCHSLDQRSVCVCARARCGISRRTLINNLIEEPVSVLQPRERGAGSLIKTDLAACARTRKVHARARRDAHRLPQPRKRGK